MNFFLEKIFNEKYKVIFGILTGVLIALITHFFLKNTAIFQKMENLTFDARQNNQKKKVTVSDIVILDIDDNSLDFIGKWPWNRVKFKNIIACLNQNEAKEIVFDIAFLQASKRSINVDDGLKSTVERAHNFTAQFFKTRKISYDAMDRLETYSSLQTAKNSQIESILQFKDDKDLFYKKSKAFLSEMELSGTFLLNIKTDLSRAVSFFNLQEENIKEVDNFFNINTLDPDDIFSKSIATRKNVILAYHFSELDSQRILFIDYLDELDNKKNKDLKEIIESFEKKYQSTLIDLKWARKSYRINQISNILKDNINTQNSSFYNFLQGQTKEVVSFYKEEIKRGNQFANKNLSYMNEIIDEAREKTCFSQIMEIISRGDYSREKIFSNLKKRTKWNTEYSKINAKQLDMILNKARSISFFVDNNSINIINDSNIKFPDSEFPDLPVYKISSNASLGFINAQPDLDGIYRRVYLLRKYKDKYFPQLAFASLLKKIGFDYKKDVIKISKNRKLKICFKNNKSAKNFNIPLNSDGSFFVNWAGKYVETFSHISAGALIDYTRFCSSFISTLSNLEKEFLPNYFVDSSIKAIYEKQLDPSIESNLSESLKRKKTVFLKTLLKSIKFRKRMLEKYLKGIDNKFEKNKVLGDVNRINNLQKIIVEDSEYYEFINQKFKKLLHGKICIIGHSATSSIDLGNIPLQKDYPMCGLHGNVINTFLTGQFIKLLPDKLELLFLIIFGLMTGFSVPKFKIANGAAFCLFQIVFYSLCAYYLFSKSFILINLFTPLFVIVFTYLIISVLRFIYEEKQKKFIKSAFGQYLAPVIVEQISRDPSRLKLGGERKICTSYFSDVAGFSTISEHLTPEDLVALLNEYLTAMTDIIIANNGTIDKYEGDAIIALFGAPVDFEDHAARACFASIEMQKILVEMRGQWARQGKDQLFVRMGLNSGPMVVGNMGSLQRMDYTMMGDTVNLAARLEGANKPYGTYTMISEYTYDMCCNFIDVRELDKIRVVGKKEPVTVYELLDKKNCLKGKKTLVVESFMKSLELYKQKKWKEALKAFDITLKIDPSDKPSEVYLQRCVEFLKTPPPQDWDGVFVLKSK